ncbi:hypothetical protein [Sphingomonas azotifigens]|uniref:hypothetical protein n=1 Tax=Sphingomonas azotifigens TaxID=330920 RepID=UPI000A02680D|nr:hypothetical protein [Sphingomonas azotifigens]
MRRADATAPARAGVESSSTQPTPEAIRAQLERLRTRAFAGSGKLFSFLRFVVEEALEGRAATLKELVIGIELYGGVIDYDPRIDSTVRVEARRLRRKLATYYAGPGRSDTVIVTIPTGSYAPCFLLREEGDGLAASSPSGLVLPPMLAVLPFTALCALELSFAAGITDELIYSAERTPRLRVAARAIMFQFRASRYSLDDVAAQVGADFVLHGTVRRAKEVRRTSVELSNRWGQILWSDRIDMTGEDDLALQEQIAAEILARLPEAVIEPA